MTTNDENRWYFTKEQLENSPSRHCGMDADKELSQRQQAANFIQDMGQRLQVTQLCINTAIVYMHRFYCYHSFTLFHRNAIAAAAIFLAAKVEEQPRKLEHIIRVTQMLLQRNPTQLDRRSEVYLEQAQELVMNENILLMTLGFDVAIEHPHAFIVKFCHIIKASKDLSQTSYFMASNSLHLTTMCLQYKPTVVACFCIHLVCKWSNCQIPRSSENLPWYSYIDPNVTEELLEQLTNEFLVIFDKCPSRLKKKIQNSQANCQSSLSNYSFDVDSRCNRQQLNSNSQSTLSAGSAISSMSASSSLHHQPQHIQRQQQQQQQSSNQQKANDSVIQQQIQHCATSKVGHGSDVKKTLAVGVGHTSVACQKSHSTSLVKGCSSSSSSVNGIGERNAAVSSHKLPNSSNSVILPQSVRVNSVSQIAATVNQTTSQAVSSCGQTLHKTSSTAAAAAAAATTTKNTRSSGGPASHNAVAKDVSSSFSISSVSSSVHRLDQSKKPLDVKLEVGSQSATSTFGGRTSTTIVNNVASSSTLSSSSYGLPNGHLSRVVGATNIAGCESSGTAACIAEISSSKKENGTNQESISGNSRSVVTFGTTSQSEIISHVVKEVALARQYEKQQRCDTSTEKMTAVDDLVKCETGASGAFSKSHSIFSPSPVATKTSPYGEDCVRNQSATCRTSSVTELAAAMKRVDCASSCDSGSDKHFAAAAASSSSSSSSSYLNCGISPVSREVKPILNLTSSFASSNVERSGTSTNLTTASCTTFMVPLKSSERNSSGDFCEQSKSVSDLPDLLDGNNVGMTSALPSSSSEILPPHVGHKKKRKHKEKDKKHDKEKRHHRKEKKKHKDEKHRKDRKEKDQSKPEPLKITIPKEKLQFEIPVKPQSSTSLPPMHHNHQSDSERCGVKLKIKLPKSKSHSVSMADNVVVCGNSSTASTSNGETEQFSLTNNTTMEMSYISNATDSRIRINKEKVKSRKRHRDSDHEDVSKKHGHYTSESRNGF